MNDFNKGTEVIMNHLKIRNKKMAYGGFTRE